MRKSFENRRRLPFVVDEIHRRTIVAHLAKAGLKLRSGDWDELHVLSEQWQEGDDVRDDFTTVKYSGRHTFGPLLDGRHYLLESTPTTFALHNQQSAKLGEWLLSREIYIQKQGGPDLSFPSRILFIPDSPPLAVHGSDYGYVQNTLSPESRDTDIIGDIEKSFGPDAVELVSEETAGEIIHALEQDATHIDKLDF